MSSARWRREGQKGAGSTGQPATVAACRQACCWTVGRRCSCCPPAWPMKPPRWMLVLVWIMPICMGCVIEHALYACDACALLSAKYAEMVATYRPFDFQAPRLTCL